MDEKWNKNISPVGWYIATEILRFIDDGVEPDDPHRRFLIWENLILIRADSPETAYAKAMEHGHLCDEKTRGGTLTFEGLRSLVPIYDELEDGAEILWMKYRRSSKKLRKLVKPKDKLEVFGTD